MHDNDFRFCTLYDLTLHLAEGINFFNCLTMCLQT